MQYKCRDREKITSWQLLTELVSETRIFCQIYLKKHGIVGQEIFIVKVVTGETWLTVEKRTHSLCNRS